MIVNHDIHRPTGVGDSVRCFYCGVTLRNWKQDDDPWETHVRFRFSCAYIDAIKGDQYVRQTLVKIANGHTVTVTCVRIGKVAVFTLVSLHFIENVYASDVLCHVILCVECNAML